MSDNKSPIDTAVDVFRAKENREKLNRLLAMDDLERAESIKKYANEMGIAVTDLRVIIKKELTDSHENAELSAIEELEPHEDPVSGDALLNEIATTLSRHVHLPAGAATALSLWVLGTYLMEAWRLWPKILITSPEKRCGKSTLLEALEGAVNKALLTSNISPSAIFRCIDEWHPTLMIDEADTFAKNNDELNGIINAGHTRRTAQIIRSEKEGETFRPKAFSVWSPQIIAGIGTQRDTLHDRSIHIEMERKLPDERVAKLPPDFFETKVTLRRQCLRWAIDNINDIKLIAAEVPSSFNDRAQDNWEPLFRISIAAGGDWPEKVKKAYLIFTTEEAVEEDAGILLLRDIQQILKGYSKRNIASKTIVDDLIQIEDSPWFEWKRGKPLTQNTLSRLLKPFKIKPTTVDLGNGKKAKGYKSEQFKKVFDRYLSVSSPNTLNQSVTPLHPSAHVAYSQYQSVTTNQEVTLSNPLQPSNDGAGNGVTLRKPIYRGKEELLASEDREDF